MNPKLSVVVPVLNGEAHICRCLDSLLNQCLKDIQIIVVDDGSDDNTVQIVRHYIKQTTTIELLQHEKNMGTGAARNSGIEHALGEYIAFLDSDDWMDIDGYFELVDALDTSGSDIGICDVYTEHGGYHLSEIRYQYRHRNIITGRFGLRLLGRVNTQSSYIGPRVGNKVFRLEFLKRHGLHFPEYPMWEDDMFTFLCLYHAKQIELVPNVAEHYYQRENSAMHSFSIRHIEYFAKVFAEMKQILSPVEGELTCAEEFFALFDRCLNTLFDSLFANEPRVSMQREYISLLINRILSIFTIEELMEYLEPQRIRRLWL